MCFRPRRSLLPGVGEPLVIDQTVAAVHPHKPCQGQGGQRRRQPGETGQPLLPGLPVEQQGDEGEQHVGGRKFRGPMG